MYLRAQATIRCDDVMLSQFKAAGNFSWIWWIMGLRHFGIKTTVTAWALNQFELVPPRELRLPRHPLWHLRTSGKVGVGGPTLTDFWSGRNRSILRKQMFNRTYVSMEEKILLGFYSSKGLPYTRVWGKCTQEMQT